MKPETRLVAKMLKWLRARPGSWTYKVPGGPFKKGLPDIFHLENARFYAFEAKSPETGYQPTKLQLHVLGLLRAAGGTAEVVYSLEDVQAYFV